MRTLDTGPRLEAADSAGRVGRVMAGTPSSPPGTKWQSGKLWKYCIGLMTWLHAKLILNNHFVLSWKLWLVFHKTFSATKKKASIGEYPVQNNGGLIVWILLSVVFMSIWLMMFKNFFTLFKILSARKLFFPWQPFVSSIALSRPLKLGTKWIPKTKEWFEFSYVWRNDWCIHSNL